MISEEAYAYDAGRTGSKTVVLCEEDDDAQEINSREKEELIGVCKYQPSYQLLHTVMRYDRKDRIKRSGMLKAIGVYGFNNTKRILLSLALARVLSESGNTLFISFEVFSCLGNILKVKVQRICRTHYMHSGRTIISFTKYSQCNKSL